MIANIMEMFYFTMLTLHFNINLLVFLHIYGFLNVNIGNIVVIPSFTMLTQNFKNLAYFE